MTLRQQTILIWIHISLTAPDVDWYDRTFHHPPLTWILNCLYTRPELRMNRLYGHCSRQGWMNYQHPLQKKTKGQKPAFIFSAQFLFLFFSVCSIILPCFCFPGLFPFLSPCDENGILPMRCPAVMTFIHMPVSLPLQPGHLFHPGHPGQWNPSLFIRLNVVRIHFNGSNKTLKLTNIFSWCLEVDRRVDQMGSCTVLLKLFGFILSTVSL